MRLPVKMYMNGKDVFFVFFTLLLCFAAVSGSFAAEESASSERETQSVAFFYKNAQRAIQKKNYAEALEAIENGLERSPSYLPFLWQKSLVLTRLGRHEEASKVIALAMSAMPDNVELNTLAVENIMATRGNDPKALEDALIICFKRAGRNVLPQLVGRLVETYSNGKGRLPAILRALAASDALEERDRPILRACMDNNPELAAGLLKAAGGGLEAKNPRARLIAAFSFLTARGLQSKKQSEKATEMYDMALGLGYDREKLIADWAGAYMALKEPLMAAKLYESYWRDSSQPQLWASRIATARRAGGQAGKALEMTQKAVGLFPDDPFLEGQNLFYLYLSGGAEATRAYFDDLQRRKEIVGLNYGRYLIAVDKKDHEAINETRAALLEAVRNTTTVHPRDSVRYIVEGLNLTTKVPEMSHQADLLRETGWKLWDERKAMDAFIHWRDAVSVDPERNRSANANIIQLLMSSGMVAQALEMYRIMFPDMPEFALALMLVRAEQWSAAWPVLSTMRAEGDFAVWHALCLAYSGLKSGAPKASVDAAARRFLAMAPPSKAVSCQLPDRDSGISLFVLDLNFYNSVLKEFLTEIFRQGYTDLLNEVIESRQFKLISPRAGASMLAEAAFDLTSKDAAGEAAPLWWAAYRLDPTAPDVNLGMALLAKIDGDRDAVERHMRFTAGCSPLKREYVLGRMCLIDGKLQEAAAHFKNYIKGARGNYSAAYQLFNLFLGMRDFASAREIKAYLAKNSGNGEAMLYQALCEQGLGNYKAAEKIFRAILKKRPGYVPAVRGLVASLRSQDRLDEAERVLAAAGMEDPEVLTVLRRKAERAMKGKNPAQAEEFAEEYLRRDPDSIYMNDVYNVSMREQYRMEKAELDKMKRDKHKLDKGRLDEATYDPDKLAELKRLTRREVENMQPDDAKLAEAEEHATGILERNKIQYNALESMLDIALQRERFKEAAYRSRDMTRTFPQDPYLALQSSIHMGAISRFDYSLPLAEKMAARGSNGAAMTVCFANISALPREDAYTPQDIENHLIYFKKNYRFVSLNEALEPSIAGGSRRNAFVDPRGIPMLVIIGRGNPAEIAAIDAVLTRQGGRAALVVGEESFMDATPLQWPDIAFLRQLSATGRWEFILTDTADRSVARDASGRKSNFWGGRTWLGDRQESREEMRTRWQDAIARIKARAIQRGINPQGWMYPGGDYGQLGLDADDDVRAAYAEAVKANFFTAFVPTGTGYHLYGADPLHMPVRNLYFPLDDKALAAMPEAHPTRLAVLDEAILSSWHGQLPRAERLFGKSEDLGLSAKDISYYRAANALFDGDAAYANELAREARALDPDNPRTEILLERAEHMLRPRIAFTPRWWRDDAERDYSEYTLSFATHVNDKLQLSASVSEILWGYKGKYTEAQAVGVGLRYYPFKQHWIDLFVRGVAPNSKGDAFWEGRAAWHGAYATDFLNINGEYNLVYNRGGIETRDSIRKGIYADRFALNTSMRVLNWGVLDGEGYFVSRTDGNNTWGLNLHPGYILWDKPYIKLGYLFNTAQSDKNPREYYAPQDYVSHMGTITGKHELFKDFFINGMFGIGMATSRNKDWRQVLRYVAGASYALTDDLSLEGGYQRLEMPDYTLDQFNLGIQYVF